MFSEKDKLQIESRGSELSNVEKQIEDFRSGFPFLDIQKAASIGDGIFQYAEEQIKGLADSYSEKISGKEVLKFVPASGAATRMFKDLFAFLDDNDFQGNKAAQTFIHGLKNFAFANELNEALDGNTEDLVEQEDYSSVVRQLLESPGLGYGNLPKGLLSFHKYENGSRTPFEEHLVEGANYARDSNGNVKIHYTVSPEHQQKFEELLNQVRPIYESLFNVTYDISFSQQKKATDTIAVDLDNAPFREEDGALLFRPAGHGALLENLNDLDADLIYIKNIDNVAPDRLKDDTFNYKKALGATLLHLQSKNFENLRNLDNGSNPDDAAAFCTNYLGIDLGDGFSELNTEEKKSLVRKKLNRPMRVCGMVKNTGEPGGGPFWVKGSDGALSLQIAETAQIDLENEDKASMLQSSSHFNPVDLVCGIKDYQGGKFDLLKYRDDNTGFVSLKSKNGKDLKAMELPGLWNGAMANWITIFVEVPVSTFSPVKTVNDLLKDVHQ